MTVSDPKPSVSSPVSGTPVSVLRPISSNSTLTSDLAAHVLGRKPTDQALSEKEKLQRLQESPHEIEKNVLARQINQFQGAMAQSRSAESDEGYQRRYPPSRLNNPSLYRRNGQRADDPTHPDRTPSPNNSSSSIIPSPIDSSSLLPLPPPPSGPTPTRRRSKVPTNDHKNTDIEFATEIGQGLLVEVRKMQAQLQEKDEQLRALEIQKADLERTADALAKQVRHKEETEEKLKEETWNLELRNQELTSSANELQQGLSKATADQQRLTKQLQDVSADNEQLRGREEKTSANMDTMKQRHEQDMSAMRRLGAGLKREKADLVKQIESLASELAIAKAQTRIAKRSSTDLDAMAGNTGQGRSQDSDAASGTNDTPENSVPGSSAPPSPKQSPARNQAMEVETLKTSLSHAHRMVSNLRSALHREKMEKIEVKKLLAESQETIEQLQNDPRLWEDAVSQGRGTHTGDGTSARKSRRGRLRAAPTRKTRGKTRLARDGEGDDVEESARRKDKDNQPVTNDSVYSYSSYNSNLDSGDTDDSETEIIEGDQFASLSSELERQQKQQPYQTDTPVARMPMWSDSFTSPVAMAPVVVQEPEPRVWSFQHLPSMETSLAPVDKDPVPPLAHSPLEMTPHSPADQPLGNNATQTQCVATQTDEALSVKPQDGLFVPNGSINTSVPVPIPQVKVDTAPTQPAATRDTRTLEDHVPGNGPTRLSVHPVLPTASRPVSPPPPTLLAKAIAETSLRPLDRRGITSLYLPRESASPVPGLGYPNTLSRPSSSLLTPVHNHAEMDSLPPQTVIGEWLWKYTRRRPTGHTSCHQRFFWIQPYTRTLHWSEHAPGEMSSAKAKRVYIKNVSAIADDTSTNGPADAPRVSILIETHDRPIRITAPDLPTHQVWLETLKSLTRDAPLRSATPQSSMSPLTVVPRASLTSLPSAKRKHRSLSSLAALAHHHRTHMTPGHEKGLGQSHHPDDDPLEDVRECCGGQHHVSRLDRGRLHRRSGERPKSRATIMT